MKMRYDIKHDELAAFWANTRVEDGHSIDPSGRSPVLDLGVLGVNSIGLCSSDW